MTQYDQLDGKDLECMVCQKHTKKALNSDSNSAKISSLHKYLSGNPVSVLYPYAILAQKSALCT